MSLFDRRRSVTPDADQPVMITGVRGPAREFQDGSGVRVSVDVDPHQVRDFHRAFPGVGMPVALARLTEKEGSPVVLGVRCPVREQLDGTLRVFVDIGKEHRNTFFETFQTVGEPVVLTALRVERNDQVKAGKFCRLAGEICRNYGFRVFVGHQTEGVFEPVDDAAAAQWLRAECGVSSRKELDADADAADRFRLVQSRFIEWAQQHSMEAICQ